jgi:hypothetical protein
MPMDEIAARTLNPLSQLGKEKALAISGTAILQRIQINRRVSVKSPTFKR